MKKFIEVEVQSTDHGCNLTAESLDELFDILTRVQDVSPYSKVIIDGQHEFDCYNDDISHFVANLEGAYREEYADDLVNTMEE